MKRNFAVLKVGKWKVPITFQDVVIFKTVLTIGLVSVYFLPGHIAAPVTAATNLLWLWRGS